MPNLLEVPGFGFASNITSYGAANLPVQSANAYYLDAAGASGTAATRIYGEASVYYRGNLARIIVMRPSTNASSILTVWDSNDPAVTTNKRSFVIGLYAGTGAASLPTVCEFPVEFMFTEGLCAQITDAAGIAKVLFHSIGLVRRASNYRS